MAVVTTHVVSSDSGVPQWERIVITAEVDLDRLISSLNLCDSVPRQDDSSQLETTSSSVTRLAPDR
jgi:hypothetical protein